MEEFVTVVVERNPSISDVAAWKWNASDLFSVRWIVIVFWRKNLKPRIGIKILSWYFDVDELFEGTTSEIADGRYWTFTRNFESWQFVILLKYFQVLNGQAAYIRS